MPTPEDIEKLKALLAAQSGNPLPPKVDIPQISPQAMADPYSKSAQGYNAKADVLEKQAMQPKPEPQTGREQLITGLRNAMESMGRWGAPGGYYGQEELRDQEFEKQNATRMSQAQKLRDLAEKQQGLGINAENVARQENYNQGQLEETRQLRTRQDEQLQETTRHNNAMEDFERNKPQKLTQGEILTSPGGKTLATNVPKPSNLRHVTVSMNGKPEIWSIGADSKLVEKIGDAPAGTAGQSGMLSVQQSTDEGGNPVYTIVNKGTATSTPVTQQGTGAPLQTSDLGKANAKNDAKFAADYETSANSLAAMKGLMERGTYASDQAMADAFFNIIKPGSGARMNENQINRFITPGPLRDKMLAWAQKLDGGQPLTPDARRDLFETARITVQAKQPKSRSGAPATPGAAQPASGGWSARVVGQ